MGTVFSYYYSVIDVLRGYFIVILANTFIVILAKARIL